ncbi:UNKNOWN [Stylonychia lemnae]|uniref:Amino acid transporter transmembrane domain-containing protein n=1 Tax=Stylonychia lemnae TaxID=5949 RepID=A0A078B192_STYLE|nr:UNKNOWN [Stylonychia lemnae]|eukprot:CDW86898.1 UNKNOWN [Stylonychia lemnae]
MSRGQNDKQELLIKIDDIALIEYEEREFWEIQKTEKNVESLQTQNVLKPVIYTKHKLRQGGESSSVFSLIAATIGAGTLTFPYAIHLNGLILGTVLIVIGAIISYQSGMLIVAASVYTQKSRYEDISLALYGPKMKYLTSICNLGCLLGFIMSFIVFQKESIPLILHTLTHKDNIPYFMSDNFTGEVFWGTLYSFLLVFPLSLPRQVGRLSIASALGVLCTIYVAIVVTFIFLTDKQLVPSPIENLKKASMIKLSFSGVTESFPMILFAYMFQVNITMIYNELERKNMRRMNKVVWRGSFVGMLMYAFVGIFGYLTFGNLSSFLSVLAATPLCILPAKETVEELLYQDRIMTKKQNIIWTFILLFISYFFALFIPSIGDAMALAGCTTNPMVNFSIMIVHIDWIYHTSDAILENT